MATVEITKVTDKQKKKRIIIQNKVYEIMDKLELSDDEIKKGIKSYNRTVWENKFKNMSDIDFYNLMLEMKKRRGYCFSFEANSITDKKHTMNVNKLNKVAKEMGFKLREYVVFPHKNRANPDNPVISKTPLPIIAITVKRLQQMLTKKNKTSSDNSVVNPVTGQVTNDSKAARLSNAQTYSLMTSGQPSAIKEYLSIRADDEVAKKQMFKEIEQTGKAKLKNYTLKPYNKQSIQAMEVFLRSAGLYSNILKETPTSINQSKEDLINDGVDSNNKDISFYKMLILGEMHQDAHGIKVQNKLIEKFKPNYILHEMVPPGDIIDPKEARRKLNDKDVMNHLQIDYSDILVLGAKLNCTLVGIDALQSSMKNTNDIKTLFVIRESKMIQHIDQFYALPSVRIAVVVGDTHLRYFKTNEIGFESPIIKKYINDEDTLIIRAAEIKREINRLKDYKCDFISTKPQMDEIERYDIFIEEDKEKTKVGYIFVKYVVDLKNNTVKFNDTYAKFIGIKIFDDYRQTNVEKFITENILNKFTNNDYYMLFPSDSKYINKSKVINEFFNYDIEISSKDFICIRI